MAKTKNKVKQEPKTLKAPKPNAGIEREYRKKLLEFNAQLQGSLKWWLIASLKKSAPASKLKKEFAKLSKFWNSKADEFSKKTAEKIVLKIGKSVDDSLRNEALKFGIRINTLRKSSKIRAVTKAKISENMALIKSIPQEVILRNESIFYNAIANLDQNKIAENLEPIYKKLNISEKIAKNRIKTIARDQTAKITEQLSQARAVSAGFEYYVWLTANDERVSGNPSGKYPNDRGGHYYLNGRIYKYGESTAIIDSYGNVGSCGERVNCRCVSGAVFLMPNEKLELIRDAEHGDYYQIAQE